MKFKMKKIAAAVTVGLGASVVGVNAQADEILFPYVAKSDTVTTIVSIVTRNLAGAIPGFIPSERLHYRYWYKPAAANMDACQELNFRRPTSPNDIQTFDVSDTFAEAGALGVLFNDPSINNDYLAANATFAGLDLADPDAALRSFLLVDNNDLVFDVIGVESLYGEAAVIEFQSGAAWGYQAYNSMADEAIDAGLQGALGLYKESFSFSNQFETTGEVLKGGGLSDSTSFNPNTIAIFPDDEFVTKLFVTPIADSVDLNGNGRLDYPAEIGSQNDGDITTTVRPFVFSVDFGPAVAVDRDENLISGPTSKQVTCVAGISLGTTDTGSSGDLFSLGVLNALKATGSDGGGWTNILVDNITVGDNTNEAVVMKLEYNRGSTFNGQNYPNVFNNAVWLRNGTDRYPAYENLNIVPVFDVAAPAGVWDWATAFSLGGSSAP